MDHKTVQSVREERETRGEIPHVATKTDTLGRKQPARKHVPTQQIPEEADLDETPNFAKSVRQKKAAEKKAENDELAATKMAAPDRRFVRYLGVGSYEASAFEIVTVDWDSAQEAANSRCKGWGYRRADPFEGEHRQCTQFNPSFGCVATTVSCTYQCLG